MMSLETLKSPRRPIDLPRDKPRVERVEHANLDRPGAVLHPRAARGWGGTPSGAKGWEQYQRSTGGWR